MGYFQDLGTGMTIEAMSSSTDAQEARAFGWELAGLMLEALREPVSPDEATAIGEHAAEVIAERVLRLPVTDGAEETARLWTDAASWGFRDRMAIAREIAEPDGERIAPVARSHGGETEDAALRLLGGRDARVAAGTTDEPAPPPAKEARAPRTKRAGKEKPKAGASGPKRRRKPSPVA